MNRSKIGLTLSGGGARGAYQAGVLKAIHTICQFKESPFRVISGVSAGSINGMAVAAGADDFGNATALIWDTWLNLRIKKIFKTDILTLANTAKNWLMDLSLGDWISNTNVTHLLETQPLRELLTSKIDMTHIEKHLESGLLHGVVLSATDYHSGKCVSFYDGDSSIVPWERNSGLGQRSKLTIEHIMASTAIPIFFPPVRIDHCEYGDGGIALSAPLSPAIHLGAEKIMIIGLEHEPIEQPTSPKGCHEKVTIGDIAGTLLNSLFLKALDSDVARLDQTNKLLSVFTPDQLKTGELQLKPIPTLFIRPSQDLGDIDRDQFRRFPFAVKHMLKGFGVSDVKGWDLLSYLAFDISYATALLELGYKDGLAAKDDILEFFEMESPGIV